jgi:hypothetical protein
MFNVCLKFAIFKSNRINPFYVYRGNGSTSVTIMHLSPSTEMNHYNLERNEKESFAPVIKESQVLNQKITTFFKVSNDITADITQVANKGDFDLLLVGIGQSIYEGSLMGRILGFTTRVINPNRILNQVSGKERLFENPYFDERTRFILSKSNVPVGILLEKEFSQLHEIFIPIFSDRDAFLISYAQKFIHNSSSQIKLLDVRGKMKSNSMITESCHMLEQIAPGHTQLLDHQLITNEFLKMQNFMLISMNGWKDLLDTKKIWLSELPSTLIIDSKI